jgi:hypothetical protein
MMARYIILSVSLTASLLGEALLGAPAKADIAITRQDCQYLVRHQPAPDVAYQPGVDVHGNPVAPADLNGGAQIKLPETIYIPIEVDIGQRYHIPANSPLWKATAELGTVAITGDQVTYNGQPLTPDDNAALVALCREKLGQ